MFANPRQDLRRLLKRREDISYAMIEARTEELEQLEDKLEEVEDEIADKEKDIEDMSELRSIYNEFN